MNYSEFEKDGAKHRDAIVAAAAAAGLNDDKVGQILAKLATGSDKRMAFRATERLLDLMGAMPMAPKHVSNIKVEADQRSVQLRIGNGDLPGVDMDQLNQLPPAARRKALAKHAELQKLLSGDEDDDSWLDTQYEGDA